MMKLFKIAAIGASMAAAPAVAQEAQPTWVDKAGRAAETTIGVLYGGSAVIMCGKKACYKPGSEAGKAIFRETQDASRRGAAKLQEVGRGLRNRRQ